MSDTIREPIPISEAEANEIAEAHQDQPRRTVVIHHGGQWYDVRHLDDIEMIHYLAGLTRLLLH